MYQRTHMVKRKEMLYVKHFLQRLTSCKNDIPKLEFEQIRYGREIYV